jgi:hypothetical protein
MTFRDGDTFYPHHPDTVPAGDYCVNSRPGDVWYLVVDEMNQGVAWDILNELLQGTSWHIHPSIIEYIAQFILKQVIETDFEADILTTNFTVLPVDTSFQVASVLDDNVGVKELTGTTAFTVIPIHVAFTLREDIVTNFKITRVLDSTRTP